LINIEMRIIIILVLVALPFFSFSQTIGKLEVKVTTSATGGKYAPRNIVAIWIESSSGEFVKTMLAYADKRMTHLNTWQKSTADAGSEFNTIDALTVATKTKHELRSCTWNGTNYKGDTVLDGSYKICMELTDKNETGNYSFFEFNKSSQIVELKPGDKPSFLSININWKPQENTAIDLKELESFKVFPSPSNGFFEIQGSDIIYIEINSLSGKNIYRGNSKSIDISNQANGPYLISIHAKDKTIVKKIVKQ